MIDASIIIPARNEEFLKQTVDDILAHAQGITEIIVGLDGQWPVEPLPDHPRVTLVYHPESIGQRAITNDCARIARGYYIMKCDAHCAFDDGFDVKMMDAMQDDWTMAPIMRNLHVFNWVCDACGTTRYQGPSGPCAKCGQPTRKDIVWIAKQSPQSRSYSFDSTPHFAYFRDYSKRPEGKGDITETMSLQGSCWMLTKKKYFELDICDESFGSWGSQGIEVAVKTWLSGGRVVINQKTWQAHCFRTQGADFSFPYALSGRQVERAKQRARDLFFENKWEKQIYPLSWLIEKFKPVPGWHDESGRATLERIMEAGATFFSKRTESPLMFGITDTANAESVGHLGGPSGSIGMPLGTVSFGAVNGRNSIRGTEIVNLHDEPKMEGVATGPIIANDMIKNGDTCGISHRDRSDKPSIHQSVDAKDVVMSDEFSECGEADLSIPIGITTTYPDPTLTERINGINFNAAEQSLDDTCVKSGYCEIITSSHSIPPIQVSSRLESERLEDRSDSIIPQNPTKSILYYTDNRLAPAIMSACQKQLLKSGLPIVSVSLKPLSFGQNIVIEAERGPLTMFRQILAGLEASTADIIYLCEHDVLYDPSHFEFTPDKKDVFCYNNNVWRVDSETGHALFYYSNHTSQLCAYRELLLEHYRKRVQRVEAVGYSNKIGYEPGTHHRPERIDDYGCDTWMSPVPNIDIRHKHNLTQTRWRKDQFRNQRFTKGWTEAEEVPGWDKDYLNGIASFR